MFLFVSRSRASSALTLLAAVLALQACVGPGPRGTGSTSSMEPSAAVTEPLSSPGPASPSPAATPDAEAELVRVMELRRDWGFESDAGWVRSVDADPTAVMSPLGILLTAEESDQLEQMFRDDPRSRLIVYGALRHDQFAGAYVERPSGIFVMLFTADLEQHRIALDALNSSGIRLDVRGAAFTEEALKRLQLDLVDRLRSMPGVEFLSASVDPINNMVVVEAKSNDSGLEAALEAEHPRMLDAHIFPLPGAWQNRDFGAGWRLLAAGQTIGPEAYRVRAATSAAEWEAMWVELDPANPPPVIDFATEMAASFGHGIGSSCPELRLDDVVINHVAGVVYSVTSDPLTPRACTADLAGAAFFVVALDRAAVPPSPFVVRLSERRICGGGDCGEEVTVNLDAVP